MAAAWGVIILPAVNLRLFLTSHYQPVVDYWLNVDELINLFLVNLGCHFSVAIVNLRLLLSVINPEWTTG